LNFKQLQAPSILLLLLLVSCPPADKPVSQPAGNAALPPGVIWGDEFNYTGLPDNSKWNYDIGCDGWGNRELQCYTAKRKENARVENGVLIIEARREDYQQKKYTSARLTTKGKGDWKYGRVEVRAKIPPGVGTWPAIWMLASTTPLKWPADGEIDIMEHVGFDQGRIHAAVHTEKYNHKIGTQKVRDVMVPDCTDSFHVYSMQWTEASIKISVDNKQFFVFDKERADNTVWPFDKPFHLLLNIAIGGDWGGAQGVNDNIFPVRMEVDYVRVYKN
jgi:beta-glucanase (GH16 family)